jgi:hypothetical protein
MGAFSHGPEHETSQRSRGRRPRHPLRLEQRVASQSIGSPLASQAEWTGLTADYPRRTTSRSGGRRWVTLDRPPHPASGSLAPPMWSGKRSEPRVPRSF